MRLIVNGRETFLMKRIKKNAQETGNKKFWLH